jgi:hypothetical protein
MLSCPCVLPSLTAPTTSSGRISLVWWLDTNNQFIHTIEPDSLDNRYLQHNFPV